MSWQAAMWLGHLGSCSSWRGELIWVPISYWPESFRAFEEWTSEEVCSHSLVSYLLCAPFPHTPLPSQMRKYLFYNKQTSLYFCILLFCTLYKAMNKINLRVLTVYPEAVILSKETQIFSKDPLVRISPMLTAAEADAVWYWSQREMHHVLHPGPHSHRLPLP